MRSLADHAGLASDSGTLFGEAASVACEGRHRVGDRFRIPFKDGQECAKQMGTDDATWFVALWQAAKAVAEGITDAAATDLIVAARFKRPGLAQTGMLALKISRAIIPRSEKSNGAS